MLSKKATKRSKTCVCACVTNTTKLVRNASLAYSELYISVIEHKFLLSGSSYALNGSSEKCKAQPHAEPASDHRQVGALFKAQLLSVS